MHVIDLQDDLGASLVDVFQGGLPELLKTAEVLDPLQALDRDYALILVDDIGQELRKYACHDAGNTWVSMLYLERAADSLALSPAAVKIAATNLSRIGRDQGLDIPESISKLATGEVPHAGDIVDERRVLYREPPPQPSSEVKIAGYDLLKLAEARWDTLPPFEKRAMALRIRAEAEILPMEIPRELYRYSGQKVSEKFASHMRHRTIFTRDPDLSNEYLRLVKVAGILGVDATVETLYELDLAAGLRWGGGDRYGARIPDPYLCVVDTEKQAMWSWHHGAEGVNEAQLRTFAANPESSNVFTLTFTEGLWLQFLKDPVGLFKSMPLEQQILLSRMARQS